MDRSRYSVWGKVDKWLTTVQPSFRDPIRGSRRSRRSFWRTSGRFFPDREPRFFALELCGEAGELANLEKKEWKGTVADEADYVDEAADVLIAIMNYANERGIDLARAVSEKMAEIDRRRLLNLGH